MAFSGDPKRRRRQHRRAARSLLQQGGGGILHGVARWHLQQAKFLSY